MSISTWPHVDEDEKKAVIDVLNSGKINYWTGNEGREFEKEFALYCGVEYAIAVANGTLALELALKAIEIKPLDEVIVPCRTFLASASAVVAVGGVPVIADVDVTSQNLTYDTVKPLITSQTKAIICVHLAGLPCEMDPLKKLSEEYGLFLIEDCAQAHGAEYKEKKVGSLGDIAAFSFCQDKIMTTGGEGGMVVTNNNALWRRGWSYKDHGKNFDSIFHKQHPDGFKWLHDSWGSNYRLTEMQSAIGRIQLLKLEHWLEVRKKNVTELKRELAAINFIAFQHVPHYFKHAYYKFYCFINLEKVPKQWSRDKLINLFNEQGITCFSGSCFNITYEKCFENMSNEYRKKMPNAEILNKTSLMFLCDHTIDYSKLDLKNKVNKIIQILNGV